MINKNINQNPSNAIAALILFVLIGWISSGLLFAAIASILPSFKEILSNNSAQTGDFLRAMVGINLPIMFLLPAIFVASKYQPGQIKVTTNLTKSPTVVALALAVLVIILCQPALNLIGEWNKQLSLPDSLSSIMQWIKTSESEAETMSKLMIETHSTTVLLTNILVIGILPGICEEFLFRGVIQSIFTDWFKRKHLAVWATAFVFSFIHFQFLGFIPRLLLGAMLGYFVLYSGSLWTSILAHSLNNTLIVILSYLQFNHIISNDIESLGYGNTAWIGVMSIAFSIVIFVYFINRKIPNSYKDL